MSDYLFDPPPPFDVALYWQAREFMVDAPQNLTATHIHVVGLVSKALQVEALDAQQQAQQQAQLTLIKAHLPTPAASRREQESQLLATRVLATVRNAPVSRHAKNDALRTIRKITREMRR